MKPRHAAALALVGWYLMIPPSLGGFQYDLTAPISKWQQDSSYDSADNCEEHRMKVFDMLTKHKVRNLDAKTQDGNARTFFYSKCIATDDPRLKEN